QLLADGRIGLRPASEPVVNFGLSPGIRFVRDDVAEERQLEAPALNEMVALRGFGKRMGQAEPRTGRLPLQLNRDDRAARGNRSAARIAVREHDALWRCNLQ